MNNKIKQNVIDLFQINSIAVFIYFSLGTAASGKDVTQFILYVILGIVITRKFDSIIKKVKEIPYASIDNKLWKKLYLYLLVSITSFILCFVVLYFFKYVFKTSNYKLTISFFLITITCVIYMINIPKSFDVIKKFTMYTEDDISIDFK